MLRSRIIVCLLLNQGRLVKTQQFSNPKYIGDPLNTVRIFNEKQADELMLLDIGTSSMNYQLDYDLVEKIAIECRVPLCYGGGVKSASMAKRLVNAGVEKIAVSSAAISNPKLISDMVKAVGSQSIVAVLDIKKKKNFFGHTYQVLTHNGKRIVDKSVDDLINVFQSEGVGEIVINAIDNDGMLGGYDLELCKNFHNQITVPLTILGGAGSYDDLQQLIKSFRIVGA